ncbi:hypothetical protein Taro_045115 [Colocasia esculenta]|uniref:Uncharacterized protein n=1 Tax=Colocasia esculenta TaxID=4460 RepID=A0A843WQD9_COLES|nr:hypothetical protein [Colocasia esculenta]
MTPAQWRQLGDASQLHRLGGWRGRCHAFAPCPRAGASTVRSAVLSKQQSCLLSPTHRPSPPQLGLLPLTPRHPPCLYIPPMGVKNSYPLPCEDQPSSRVKVHIVYLGLINHGHDPLLTTKSHIRLLSNHHLVLYMHVSDCGACREEEAKEAMLYSYRRSFSGFAAMLNSTQATTLGSMEEVISVFKSKTLQLHTTRSWEFMGLASSEIGVAMPVTNSTSADNVVVGVFDTGVWPESGSFREDAGMPPVPPSWKGTCVKGEKFDPDKACNKKLVGARYYNSGFEREFGPLNTSGDAEYRSPRDRLGHGTHTASTAVGAAVEGAGFFGLAPGTARGGAPRARLAAYKVCWLKDLLGQCSEADILKAFDDALADGVGVISASLGASPPLSPFSSSSDIGSFHAAQMGVLVVFSAGNDGLEASLVQNVSPWSVCVAASTIDRSYPTQLMLGNNISIMGEGFILLPMKMRLVDGSKYFSNGACDFQRWKGNFATGSIVLCFSNVGSVTSGSAALAVLVANGSAMIFAEPLTRKAAQDDLLPSVHVDIYQGTRILYYIQSAGSNAMVQVMRSKTAVGRSPAPSVAYFSSRGPSSITPNILKPDITAPGVNILAAWPPTSPPSVLPIDGRSVEWNFDSGTSMSCPHVSGVAALLKSVHPDWSPAAVKSALMTTGILIRTNNKKLR